MARYRQTSRFTVTRSTVHGNGEAGLTGYPLSRSITRPSGTLFKEDGLVRSTTRSAILFGEGNHAKEEGSAPLRALFFEICLRP